MCRNSWNCQRRPSSTRGWRHPLHDLSLKTLVDLLLLLRMGPSRVTCLFNCCSRLQHPPCLLSRQSKAGGAETEFERPRRSKEPITTQPGCDHWALGVLRLLSPLGGNIDPQWGTKHEANFLECSKGSIKDLWGMKWDLGGIGLVNKSRPVESCSRVTAGECCWHGEGHAPLKHESRRWSRGPLRAAAHDLDFPPFTGFVFESKWQKWTLSFFFFFYTAALMLLARR